MDGMTSGGVVVGDDVVFESRIGNDALCSTGNIDVKSGLVGTNGGTLVELDFPR